VQANNRAGSHRGLSCVHIETNPEYTHNPNRTGNKNIMHDKRVKAYSNSRPRLADIHIDRGSGTSPLCLRPFAKALSCLNGSTVNLVSRSIDELDKPITVFTEQMLFFFFLPFESS